MNADRAFFDTNVLLYMYTKSPKRAVARRLVDTYVLSGAVLVSTQVIQEFYAAGSRKLNISRDGLKKAISDLLELPVISLGPSHILSAIENEERYQISFWDALIVAAAQSGGADVLYTEDLNDGQQYGTVMVRNPFLQPPVNPQ
jgi:predicted nucleic acid-binding protein